MIQHPNTISECRENLQKVLSMIKTKRGGEIPPRLLDDKALE